MQGAFNPTALVVIETVFDHAWSEIADHFCDTDTEDARRRLAKAVLIVAASHDGRDMEGLKSEALQPLALTYRRRWPLNWQ